MDKLLYFLHLYNKANEGFNQTNEDKNRYYGFFDFYKSLLGIEKTNLKKIINKKITDNKNIYNYSPSTFNNDLSKKKITNQNVQKLIYKLFKAKNIMTLEQFFNIKTNKLDSNETET